MRIKLLRKSFIDLKKTANLPKLLVSFGDYISRWAIGLRIQSDIFIIVQLNTWLSELQFVLCEKSMNSLLQLKIRIAFSFYLNVHFILILLFFLEFLFYFYA